MHAHGNTYMCICIRIKVCMHVCMYECMYTACLHASMHVYICSRILHVHTHKRTGTQTSTHKHTRAQGPGCGLHGRSGHKTGTDGGDHPKACTLNSKPCKISKATTIVEQKEKEKTKTKQHRRRRPSWSRTSRPRRPCPGKLAETSCAAAPWSQNSSRAQRPTRAWRG